MSASQRRDELELERWDSCPPGCTPMKKMSAEQSAAYAQEDALAIQAAHAIKPDGPLHSKAIQDYIKILTQADRSHRNVEMYKLQQRIADIKRKSSRSRKCK